MINGGKNSRIDQRNVFRVLGACLANFGRMKVEGS